MDAQARYIMGNLQDEIADLKAKIEHPNANLRDINSLTPRLQKAEDQLLRMQRDDEDVRVGAPDVPMKQKAAVARSVGE